MDAIDVRLQRMGAWCGAWYTVTLLIGWGLIAGFLPPLRPTDPPARIAALFREDATRIRIGMLFVMLAALFMIGFGASISRALARVEGGPKMLTYASLLGGVGNMVLTLYPATWWLVAAYRPDRDAALIYLMNDIGWLQFIGGVTMYLALPLSIGLAGFLDPRPEPIFPRWAGYANIWVCVLIVPDQLLFFFQTGPFAWSGLFGIYLPLVGFFGWFAMTVYLLLRAAPRTAATTPADTPTPVAAA